MVGTVPGVNANVAPAPRPDLTDEDLAILDFADLKFRYRGNQYEEIRKRFGLSWISYYQRLAGLLDHPQAYAHNPRLVRRLQKLRGEHRMIFVGTSL